MQHDEVIWQVINQGHCSYKAKTQTQNFCRNKFNVTGLCNRSSCPLANSRYATVREDNGVLYLYMKSIERAHMPQKLWERVKLPRNYGKALELVDSHLMHWPKFLVHKNKQRLTRMTQYLIRMRKLALKVKPKIVTVPAKQEKREARREAKAETAAKLDRSIEKELLQRLRSGTYGDIYNFPVKEYEKVLEMEEAAMGEVEEDEEEEDEEEEDERGGEVEYVEGYEMEEEDDMEDQAGWDQGFEINGSDHDDDEEEESDEDGDQDGDDEDDDEEGGGKNSNALVLSRKRPSSLKEKHETEVGGEKSGVDPAAKRKRRRAHVEVEYEHEMEPHSMAMKAN